MASSAASRLHDGARGLPSWFCLALVLPAVFGLPWATGFRSAPGNMLLELGLMAVFMASGLAVLAALPLLCFARTRRSGLRAVVIGMAGLLGEAGFWRLGFELRSHTFAALAERSRPLVEALHAYERYHGQPAPSLDALVPGQLPAIPGTGLDGYPAYDYQVFGPQVVREVVWYDLGSRGGRPMEGLWSHQAGDPEHAALEFGLAPDGRIVEAYADRMPAEVEPLDFDPEAWARPGEHRMRMVEDLSRRHGPWVGRSRSELEALLGSPDGTLPQVGTPWELRVDCSNGFGNWDRFIYWPTREYPEHVYGGGVELLGDWAYVHE
jgi:hypothetical protein